MSIQTASRSTPLHQTRLLSASSFVVFKRKLGSLCTICALLAAVPTTASATAECRQQTTSIVRQPHIEVELIVEPVSLDHAQSRVGILFKPDPGWHIYWKNPGDTGLAPTIEWQEGIQVGALNWPAPETIQLAHLVDQGYEGDTLLWSDYKMNDGKSVIFANTKWLVCKDECIPGSATLSADISALSDADEQKARYLFESAKGTKSRPFPTMTADAEIDDGKLKLSVFATTPNIFKPKAGSDEKPHVEVFIENLDLVEYGPPVNLNAVNNMLVWEQTLNDFKSSTPEEVRALIVINHKDAYDVTIPIKVPSAI